MKTLIDARMYGLENSGIGRYLASLISELIRITSEENFIILLRKKYYDTLKFPDNWTKVLVDIPHYTLREQIFLPAIIKKYAPDIVHFPHVNVPVFYKGNYVLTVHDLTMQKQGINATKLPLPIYYIKRIPFLLIAKYAVKHAVKIIVPSKTTATDLSNYYNVSIQKISVIYEGCGFVGMNQGILSGEMSVLSKYGLANMDYFFYVGKAYPHKNLKKAIEAIKNVNEKRNINIRFVVSGLNDFFYKKLEEYANDIGASEYLKLTGYVKDEELSILYKNSLGFLYPSLAEGFGLQGLEAISMGTTLACSNIPIFKEIYEFHAFYFDPKDVESISGTLYSIISMKREDKHKYVRNAQEFIKKYSWKKMAEETLEEYKKAMGK